MLAAASYDPEEKEMSIVFTGGRAYYYVDVEKDLFDNLISAKSAGQYFSSIKSRLKQK